MLPPSIPEGIVTQAFVEDISLRTWFLSLERLPHSARRNALSQMARQMTFNGEDPELATAMLSLVRPEMFNAVRNSVRARCGFDFVGRLRL